MRTLIVGIGALGGTVAARALHAGMPVSLATRTEESARVLREAGLRVSGIGGEAWARTEDVAPVAGFADAEKFDLILLATKAHEALELGPFLAKLLGPTGTLVAIQNGGVSQLLSERLGSCVLGGLSNLGATMVAPGIYEQRNAGHLLIGELSGGVSERAERIARFLGRAIGMRVTSNMRGSVWAKLLLNCSVTTLGALAGQTMRQYYASPTGKEVFRRAYDEALSVALASGTTPERMIVDPIPPSWNGASAPGSAYDEWIEQVLATYGDLKPSMLQDFERKRRTEIDFINGYVAQLGQRCGVTSGVNANITEMVHQIEQGSLEPHASNLEALLKRVARG